MTKRSAESPFSSPKRQHVGSDDEYDYTDNYGKWQSTISRVVQSVVSIHFSQVSNFDCDSALVSEATGFVVDAERGIILTNRHVVCAGPFVGYAVFDNHEECDVIPVYRDPVHDFGFLRFDPQNIKYMAVQHLELRPDEARVGSEIRVVGNDAGEKLSILAGFISRLDRNAPDYGSLTYNDFNTEYIQAAASASGGSSGSPVVNIDGHAVALQAGGSTEASTDFFLPLGRILRALRCLQADQPITRGTIQTQWALKPYDECKRLGLSADRESEARQLFPEKIGLLVAETVLPKGPAEGLICEGDALIAVNGEHISTFVQLDGILDSNVDKEITVLLQRSGQDVTVKCTVGDLHAITPSRYVEVCGSSFNELSYQMARQYAIPVKGVFANSATGSFTLDKHEKIGWIIDSVDHQETPDLDAFIKVMSEIPDRKRVAVKYRHLNDLHASKVSVIHIDRHWFKELRVYQRNDATGIWDFHTVGKPVPQLPLVPHYAKFLDIPIDHPGLAALSRSLVAVVSLCPIPMDSSQTYSKRSSGLVIDAKQGLVVVSRNVVPHDCLDVYVNIAESVILPATVEFLHPTQNYAVIRYDPSKVLADVVTPKFSSQRLKRGDKTHFIGYNYNYRVVHSETRVSDISSLGIPTNIVPRYKATNLEAISLDSNVASQCGSGILADEDGTIRGLWLSFLGETSNEKENVYLLGVDIVDLLPTINSCAQHKVPRVRTIDAGFNTISILQARISGVPEEWISKMENLSVDRLQFLSVHRVSYGASLVPGDIILSCDGKIVSHIWDLDVGERECVDFKIVRNSKVMDLKIETVEVQQTEKMVFWSGALFQPPHHAVKQCMRNLPSGVYVSFRSRSAPAMQYGIFATNFVTHVNEVPTPDIDSFIAAVKDIPDNTYCKMRLISFDNIPFAMSLKTNYHYFPTAVLEKDTEKNSWIESEL